MAEALSTHSAVAAMLLQGIEGIPDGMILVDLQGLVLFLNPAASRLTGWSLAEALGQDASLVFNVVNALTREAPWNPLVQALSDQQSYTLLPNSVLLSKDGTEVPIDDAISPVHDEHGAVAGVLILFKDVSLSRWQLAKALHRAQHDPLTSLPNRATLHKRILSSLSMLGVESRGLGLLFVDIDRFKSVNDSFGHAVGDFVLQVLATRIASCLRGTDLVCRVGGDEFIALIPIASGFEDLQTLVEELLQVGREPIEVLGSTTKISFSIGSALRDQPSLDVAGFIADADVAAYRAKADGGNRAQLFELAYSTETRPGRVLAHEIVEGIRLKQFLLYYQPIVDCRTGKMAATEALVRWQHPNGNLLQPVTFISAAEQAGLIVSLGRLVLEQALEQRHAWTRSGVRTFPVFVNVSAIELLTGEYVEELRDLLAEHEYEPNSLVLEITESTLLDLEQQRFMLPAIRNLGVQIAIDDFGIGYSNIGYLRNFSVDYVKIDRSFVSGVPERSQDNALVKAMMAMARSVGAHATGEGVETLDQALFLRKAGCNYAQGNFYSAPVPSERVGALTERYWATFKRSEAPLRTA